MRSALALACSWCWVIGMVFPVFMIADFGWPGWLVFVVPNAIGAASVGVVLTSPRGAERFARTHRHVIRAFTLVTITFHGFVLAWLAPRVSFMDPPWAWQVFFVGAFGAAVIAVLMRRPSLSWFVRASPYVFLASLLCVAAAAWTTSGDAFAIPPATGSSPFPAVILALAGTSLGFLTCPFLDATFLRVRAGLDVRARSAAVFVGAFALPFIVLVALTALYARGFIGDGVFSYWILAHLFVQSLYTCSFHAWAHRAAHDRPEDAAWSAPACFLLGVGLALACERLAGFRFWYECLIALYALPFPAYLWIVAVWGRAPHRRALSVCAVAIGLAAPLFAWGYLGQQWALVPLGVGLVVAAPALLLFPSRSRRLARS